MTDLKVEGKSVFTPSMLDEDQQLAIDFMYENDCGLIVAPMGAGKTICTLSAIAELIANGVLKRVLVVAPLKVCHDAWTVEPGNWQHTAHLRVSLACGSPEERRAALASDSEIVVVNFDNLIWLLDEYGRVPGFDGLVIDEISKLKDPGGAMFKALRKRLKYFSWRFGLTGTPVSEDWKGLYGQMMIVDRGASLGTRKDLFLATYFWQQDFKGYKWALQPGAEERLAAAVAKRVHTMPDYRHRLPAIEYHSVPLVMPPAVREVYDDMAGGMAAELDDRTISADTAAILSGKLMQISGGFLYHEGAKDWTRLSEYRLNALSDLVRSIGRPVMICYWYRADFESLRQRFPGAVALGHDKTAVADWNSRKAGQLLLHPRSGGHGLNLAAGGADVIWLGPVWSRDLWEQTNARLWRRGQRDTVRIWSLLADDSIDRLVVDRVDEKGGFNVQFLAHVKAAQSRRSAA